MSATILIVDDDPSIRRSVERLLRRDRYDVVVASDVDTALRYARQVAIHAALVDFHLPDADGLTVLSRLREVQPGCLRILMTGFHDYDMVVQAVNRGEVLRVLPKPFEGAQVLSTLRDAFASADRMAAFTQTQRAAVCFEEKRLLDEALRPGMLQLALQPIVASAPPNRPVAFEALLRCEHPSIDGPLALLRLASHHDALIDLGRQVFALAAARVAALPDRQDLFVNLSPVQLADPGSLVADLAPLRPFAGRVVLEITEQVHLASITQWRDAVRAARSIGFRMAVDDVGAGYNSLAVLAEVEPAFIKVDMSLVRDLHLHAHRRRVVEMVAQLADATGAQVIAEGVECAEEAGAARTAGCHLLQGYFFGRPTLAEPVRSSAAA